MEVFSVSFISVCSMVAGLKMDCSSPMMLSGTRMDVNVPPFRPERVF